MGLSYWVTLAVRSAWSRRAVLSLVALSIALSTFLLLCLQRLGEDARHSFAQSVSGTDLVVGARGHELQLLLHAVFHLGPPTGAMGEGALRRLQSHPAVAWVVPLSLGDSVQGLPVLGTTAGYFDHVRHGQRQALAFAAGRAFDRAHEVVLGARAAAHLGLQVGQRLVVSHGHGEIDGHEHGEHPFTVVGILAPTGTPTDRAVLVRLADLDALHDEFVGGVRLPGLALDPALRPRTVSAALVGLRERRAALGVRRDIESWREEPLSAALPGLALSSLWELVGHGERVVRLMIGLVAAVSLGGLVAVMLAGLEQRRRELAILRAVGARPHHLAAVLVLEALAVTVAGALLGLLAHAAALVLLAPLAPSLWGVTLQPGLSWPDAPSIAVLLAAGTLAGSLPALRACRMALTDGLSPQGG